MTNLSVEKIPGQPSGESAEELMAAVAVSVRSSFQTVEDMAQSFIREAIQQGVLPPGHRLNLDAIASTLGISRMPVRASLRQLESEGLLRIHAHRGATVSVLRPEEIAEIYELRILLEGYLLERAVENLDDALLDELATVVAELEGSPTLSERLDKRRAFYRRLYEQAHRPRAFRQVEQLRGSVGRYLLLQQVDEHQGHQEFLQLLRDRDAEASKAWVATHLTKVSTTLQGMVAEAEEEATGAV